MGWRRLEACDWGKGRYRVNSFSLEVPQNAENFPTGWGARYPFKWDTVTWSGRVAQLLWWLTTAWTVRGSNPDGGEIFCTCPDRPWGPPSLLYNGYWDFPGGKEAGAWRWPPMPSSVEVKERVELYLYSSGPSWSVIRWPLSSSLPFLALNSHHLSASLDLCTWFSLCKLLVSTVTFGGRGRQVAGRSAQNTKLMTCLSER
jgi:hypothetical protein